MGKTLQKQKLDMLHGPLWNKLPQFALPVAATAILEQLFNASDLAVVGHFSGDASTIAVAAVGANSFVISLVVNFFIGIALGANVVIANAIGRGDDSAVRRAVHTAVIIAVLGGVLVAAAGECAAAPLLGALQVPAEVYPYALLYLRIYLLGMPVILLYNFEAAVFRSIGETRIPLQALALSGILNIILNLFFVIVLKMTVNGVATATVLSNAVSAALLLRQLLKSDKSIRLDPHALRVDAASLRKILQIGLPAGLQSAVFSVSNIVVQSAINSLGTVVMAASSAAFNIEVFAYDVFSSFGQACTTFVGQNYGAGRLDRVKKGTWVTLAMGLVYTLATGALLLLGQDAIMHLFTNDETVVFFGEAAMHWFCPFYFLLSILHGLAGAVRGTGASVPPMVVLLVSLCLFRIVWIQWVLPLFSGIEGVFILYPVSWALGAGLMILYAWKGKWMEYHA